MRAWALPEVRGEGQGNVGGAGLAGRKANCPEGGLTFTAVGLHSVSKNGLTPGGN